MARSFFPILGASQTLSATASSGRVGFGGAVPSGEFQVRIYNAGTDLVFVNFGDVTVAATVAADMPVPAGSVEVITLTNPAKAPITYAAAICASSTATVYFTPGHGI